MAAVFALDSTMFVVMVADTTLSSPSVLVSTCSNCIVVSILWHPSLSHTLKHHIQFSRYNSRHDNPSSQPVSRLIATTLYL
jgi:hypothetical protein